MDVSDISLDILTPVSDLARINLGDFRLAEYYDDDSVLSVRFRNQAGQELRVRIDDKDRFVISASHGILVLHPTGGMNALGVEIKR